MKAKLVLVMLLSTIAVYGQWNNYTSLPPKFLGDWKVISKSANEGMTWEDIETETVFKKNYLGLGLLKEEIVKPVLIRIKATSIMFEDKSTWDLQNIKSPQTLKVYNGEGEKGVLFAMATLSLKTATYIKFLRVWSDEVSWLTGKGQGIEYMRIYFCDANEKEVLQWYAERK